jgi:hypothetical protein
VTAAPQAPGRPAHQPGDHPCLVRPAARAGHLPARRDRLTARHPGRRMPRCATRGWGRVQAAASVAGPRSTGSASPRCTPQDRRVGDRVGASTFGLDYFGRRAYWPSPAVLQAGAGRRVRAGLRDRPGVPG